MNGLQVLVDTLRQIQGDRTQEVFADELGISQVMLSSIYSGERRPGVKVLRALRQRYPESLPAIDTFLLSEDMSININ